MNRRESKLDFITCAHSNLNKIPHLRYYMDLGTVGPTPGEVHADLGVEEK